MLIPLFAVHISDGVLEPIWLIAGGIFSCVLLAIASFRVRDDEISRIGMLSAATFIGSQIHIPLGVSSVHLLLNGLVGVILGRRATLALAVGLVLQAILFGHGGKFSLGVNLIILSVPALLAGIFFPQIFNLLAQSPQWLRFICLIVTAIIWISTAVTTLQIIVMKWNGRSPRILMEETSEWWLLNPWISLLIFGSAVLLGIFIQRKNQNHAFFAGLLLGAIAGYFTITLNALVLFIGGMDGVRVAAPIAFLAHTPVIAVESLIMGMLVSYLAKVKPEWLRLNPGRNVS